MLVIVYNRYQWRLSEHDGLCKWRLTNLIQSWWFKRAEAWSPTLLLYHCGIWRTVESSYFLLSYFYYTHKHTLIPIMRYTHRTQLFFTHTPDVFDLDSLYTHSSLISNFNLGWTSRKHVTVLPATTHTYTSSIWNHIHKHTHNRDRKRKCKEKLTFFSYFSSSGAWHTQTLHTFTSHTNTHATILLLKMHTSCRQTVGWIKLLTIKNSQL